MRLGKKTVIWGGLGALALVFVALVAAALVLIPSKMKEKLVRAGFSEDTVVSMHLTQGLTIAGLKGTRGVRNGAWNLSVETGEVRVPMTLWAMALQRGVQDEAIHVAETTVYLSQEGTPTSKTSEASGKAGAGRARVMRALKQLCPDSCDVRLDGIRLVLKLEHIEEAQSFEVNGMARVSSSGAIQLFLQHHSGANVSTTLDLNHVRESLEAVIKNVRGLNIQTSMLSPWLPEKVKTHLNEVEFSVGELKVGAGQDTQVKALKVDLWGTNRSSASITSDELRLKKEGGAWCRGISPCITSGSGVNIKAKMGHERQITASIAQAFACGDDCLRATSAVLNVRSKGRRLDAIFADAEAYWTEGEISPGLWKLNTGRIRTFRESKEQVRKGEPSKDDEEYSFAHDLYGRLLHYDTELGRLLNLPGVFYKLNRKIGGNNPQIEVADLLVEMGIPGQNTPEIEISKLRVRAEANERTLFSVRGELRAPISSRGPLPEKVVKLSEKDKHKKMTGDGDATVETSLKVAAPLVFEVTASIDPDGSLEAAVSGEAPAWVLVHPKVTMDPLVVKPINFTGTVHRTVAIDRNTWMVPQMEIRATEGGVGLLQLGLDLDAHPKRRGVSFAIDIPEQYCSRIHRSIPDSLFPRLSRAHFKGKGSFRIEGGMRFRATRTLRLEFFPELESCIPVGYGKFPLRELSSSEIKFTINDPRMPAPVIVGPGTGDFIALNDLPDFVWGSALATEDVSFWNHSGFVPNLIRRGISLNLDRGRYVYGGSTITQQLVKNIFLTREKTMARKLEEAVLVWLVERSIDKERILELYLNCIEFGPGIYGIRHAAEVYFGVRPQDLKPIEAAWIMSVKPNPYTWGYKPWRRRFVSESRKNDMVTRIRNRLIKYEWISEEDALAMDSDTVFERVAPVDAYEIPEGWFYDPRDRDGAQNN